MFWCDRRRLYMIPDPDYEIEDIYDDLDPYDEDDD